MSEEQTRFPYKFGRVLIESGRVITPTLPSVTLQLNGGQVEMLRNIVYHLGSRNTFVYEYYDIDYETPDDDDWETITTLVADLEYKLMGNENILWGYNNTYGQIETDTVTVAGTNILTFDVVPAGEIRKLTGCSGYCSTVNPENVSLRPEVDGVEIRVWFQRTVVAWELYTELLDVTQKANDALLMYFYNCEIGDTIVGTVWGYGMVV